MNIITDDQLAKTLLAEILKPLFEQYEQECKDYQFSFDLWLWEHKELLGEQVYAVIGNRYGDADDAMMEV